jgi:molybdenum-dependent DNA-binding transcriptional regulator ModE
MNRLSTEKRTQILAALCEGASVSAAARQARVSKVTALKLLGDIGPVLLDYQLGINFEVQHGLGN